MISIIIPAYNEEGSIAAVVQEFYDAIVARHPGSELIVVNDSSTDDTQGIVERMSKDRPALRVLTPAGKLGHGGCVRYGFGHARCEWIFYTDGDYQTRADTLTEMLAHVREYDYQSGYRPRRGDGLQRVIVSHVLRLVIRTATGTDVRDANCPYKLMPRQLWAGLDHFVPADSPAPMACLESLVSRLPVRSRVLPIAWHERTAGRPSIKRWTNFARAGWRVARDLRRMQRVDLQRIPGVNLT